MSEDRLQIQLSKFDLKKESHNELMKISQLNLENSANFEVNNLGDNCAELIMRDYNEQSNVPMDEKFEVVVEIPPNRIQNMVRKQFFVYLGLIFKVFLNTLTSGYTTVVS